MNRLQRLSSEFGQSPWLDNLRRSYLTDGGLDEFVRRGVRGLTSNPTIFQKAIQGSVEYDEQFYDLIGRGVEVEEAYWSLVLHDIVGALDVFRPLYETSSGTDGFVSVEVDPLLAHDALGTLEAGRGLVSRIDRPNVMIKIPATTEGLVAIRRMTAEGHCVNVTLIFSLERYDEVITAYIEGLEQLASDPTADLARVASVASFFISRVDSEVDARLASLSNPKAADLRGKAAIAQAQLAYDLFISRFSGERWSALQARGAKVQRPLWASTSTKNPDYPDTLYVDRLIGPDTVNTLPDTTLEAFDNHGSPSRTIDVDLEAARRVWAGLRECGIDMSEVASKLESEGIASFQASFTDLLDALRIKAESSGTK